MMNARLPLSVMADWLRRWDYDVTGPPDDDREIVISVDEATGTIQLMPPPEIEPD